MLYALADGAVDVGAAPYSSATSGLVAVLAVVFSVLAFRAARARRNAALHWVGGAFVVFALMNVFSAVNVPTHYVQHDDIELVLSIGDLVIMLMLFAPFLLRRSGTPPPPPPRERS